jgi:predicted acetyltransferase
VWRLDFADGKVSVQSVDAAAAAVEITVQHLAELYLGYRTVSHLQDSLEIAGPPDQLETLAAAFPAHPTYIDDWF